MKSTQLSHAENQDLSQDELLEQLNVAERRLKRIKLGLLGSFVFILALFVTIISSSSIFSSGRFVSEAVEIIGNDLIEDDEFKQSLASIAIKYEQQLRRDLSSCWPGVAADLNARYRKLIDRATVETRTVFNKGLSSYLNSQQFNATLSSIQDTLDLELTSEQKTRLKLAINETTVKAAMDTIRGRLEKEKEIIASLKTLPGKLSSNSTKNNLLQDIPEKLKTSGHRFVDNALNASGGTDNE